MPKKFDKRIIVPGKGAIVFTTISVDEPKLEHWKGRKVPFIKDNRFKRRQNYHRPR